ncbi:hypothetical protein [Serratia symbiotica]|uniref:hypothetical protein n=1 Tax=Serratia symbiotica TaxID=138074 RepID=UPI0030D1F1B2|nr:hypothetical protein [Serratia symbiotica]
MLNKSNFWPARGSDHSPSVKIATFRGQAKFRFIQQRRFMIACMLNTESDRTQ